jgi:hypothetical protein
MAILMPAVASIHQRRERAERQACHPTQITRIGMTASALANNHETLNEGLMGYAVRSTSIPNS